ATTTIPIVIATGLDPVNAGFVNRINQPEGNVTGASFATAAQLMAKQVEFLRALTPKATSFALIVNRRNGSNVENEAAEAQAAAGLIGLTLLVLNVGTARDF